MLSIPYWLGSKLRVFVHFVWNVGKRLFQSPIGWGLSCESARIFTDLVRGYCFNPLLVGV